MASLNDMPDELPLAQAADDEFAAWPFEPFPAAALEGSLLDRFDAMVRRFPERLAVGSAEQSLTYRELDTMAARIGGAIAAAAARPGPVAILLANEAPYPAAMLGVFAAGRAYVPLDADHPIERNRQIAAQSGAVAVVAAGPVADSARAVFAGDVPVLDLDRLNATATLPRHLRPGPDDIAYITYTSGSTGRPKGVYQSHRGLLHDVMQSTNTLRLAAADRMSLFHSPSFLQGTRITFGAILNGGSVHVVRPPVVGPTGIAAEIRARRITVFRSVATLFTSVAATLSGGERLDSLRLVYLGGDRVTWGDFDVFRRACRPGAAFGVHLGSTECSTVYLQWLVDERLRARGGRLPIGRPLPDRAVSLVNEDGFAVETGEIGEFAVTSRYVALGYWREPELSARAFTVDRHDPGVRTHRTGDLGRMRPDGLYEFIGRKDAQLKLHGHRIEPGEVESALRAAPPVRDAAVVVRRNAEGVARAIIGYVELRPGAKGVVPRHVLAMAAHALPAAMVPAAIIIQEALPRLASLKVDRRRLAEIDAAHADAPAEDADPFLRRILQVFEQVLNTTGATPDDNLRTLGGNSLQAVEVALEIERQLGIAVPLRSFRPERTIREFATWVAARAAPRSNGAAAAAIEHHLGHENAVAGGPADRLGEMRAPQFSIDATAPLVSELQSALVEKRPLTCEMSGPAGWAAALEMLLMAGKLDAATKGARQLAQAYPGFAQADMVLSFLEKLPAIDSDYLPFSDRRLESVQVVERAGAETVVILFCDKYHGLGVSLSVIHRWLGRLPASLVYIRDFRRLYYLAGVSELGSDREATIAALAALARRLGARRILCYGNSAGSFAALDYGAALAAEAVLALAGPTNLLPEFNAYLRWMSSAERVREIAPSTVTDLRQVYAAGTAAARVRIVYGEHDWDDRLQAENLAGLPKVELRPVEDYFGHNVSMELIRRGQFEESLDWFVGRQ